MANSTSVDVGESETMCSGRAGIVTDPFAVSTVTGNPAAPVAEGLDVAGTLAETGADVVAAVSAVADEEPHAATTSAIAAMAVKVLVDKKMLLSLEEPSWLRHDPSSEGVSHTGGKASWLIPEGLHSCGTAPDSHRTSLRTRRPGEPGVDQGSKTESPVARPSSPAGS
jgi:hypothetical protein